MPGKGMKFGARQRWAVLLTLLMAALSAAALVRDGDRPAADEIVEAPARPTRAADAVRARSAEPAQRVHLEKLRVRAGTVRETDAFAPRTWRRPPPKAVANAVVAPPPPSAPPLPFVYMGRLFSDETRSVFLTQGERNLIVHEGDVIDALYRVASISDAGLTFVYLPSGIQQTLPIGELQ